MKALVSSSNFDLVRTENGPAIQLRSGTATRRELCCPSFKEGSLAVSAP
jgi:hypothetical protein